PDRAVHLDHLLRTGPLVQPVDVLGHDRLNQATPLELRQREMTGVRLGVGEDAHPQRVELPDLVGVAPERVDGRVLHRVVLRPDSAAGPEVGNAALGADPRAGQDDARLALAQQLDELAHRRRVPRMADFRFRTDVRVRFAETDAQGVAHNANYLVWF